MIKREISGELNKLHQYFPIISLTGPRQSGKTTLIKSQFKTLPYFNLEDPEKRKVIQEDPKFFFNKNKGGAIIDEAQRLPEIFSYLQVHVDENKKSKFVISGSQNFLLSEKITQSLSGRVFPVTLLPLGKEELIKAGKLPVNLNELIFTGFYPGIYDRQTPPDLFYPAYMQTYVERDVRLIRNIGSLEIFHRFIRLCAGRAGQLLNISNLAADTGIGVTTAKSWIALLEASYLIYLLRPYHGNPNKRLIKSPKLYFYDTGLLCHLLGLEEPKQLDTHYARGAIFENYIISEILKMHYHRNKRPQLWFWMDSNHKEIDLLIEKAGNIIPVEIKSAMTFSPSFFNNLKKLDKKFKQTVDRSFVIFAGDQELEKGKISLVPEKDFTTKIGAKLFE